MKPYHSSFVHVEGNSIHLLVSETKHDKWLVLWSGICMTAEQFFPVLASSSNKPFNVVAIDPPGHGLSAPWKGKFTQQSVQSIWEAVADNLGIQHAVIGGHSYGAMSALMGDTVLLHWVDGVILLDGGYNMPTEASDDEIRNGLDEYIQGYKFDSWSKFLEEEQTHVQQWDEVSELIARATMKESDGEISLRVDRESATTAYILCSHFSPMHVPQVQKPAFLLRATLPTELGDQRERNTTVLATRLTNLMVRDVPNSGHDVMSDNRSFVVDSVWEFLNSAACSR